MNRADCKALRSAALELASWAKALHEGHTVQNGTVWPSEHEAAYQSFAKHQRLIKRLRKIANAERAKLPARNGTDASR